MFSFFVRRVPHGTRGLKSLLVLPMGLMLPSRPAWDAWIEMYIYTMQQHLHMSRPAWDAWIEIYFIFNDFKDGDVASRMGRVD